MGFNASALSANTIKTFVDRLNKRNKEKTTWPPKRSAVQEDIAKVLGYDSWHALHKALDTPKSVETTSTSGSVSETPLFSVGEWNIPSAYNNGHFMWSRVQWSKHCLVFGNDENRCDFFSKFSQVNPLRPMLLIQGPLALPVDAKHWASANQTSQLMALMVRSLDFSTQSAENIVKTLNIWNTSSSTLHSFELVLTVCKALVQLRDTQKHPFNLDVLVTHLLYENVVELSQRTDLSPEILQDLNTYLKHYGMPQSNLARHEAIIKEWLETQKIVSPYHYPETANHRVLISHLFAPSTAVKKQVEEYLDWWVSAHVGGLIVVDGLHSDSFFYEFLLRRLAVYKRDGVGVVFGCANSGDFPNSQMYEQIQGRMSYTLTLPKI